MSSSSSSSSGLSYAYVPAQVRTAARSLRAPYFDLDWTRKTCVICGGPAENLHHSAYLHSLCRWQELCCLVPLCRPHHLLFHQSVWPAFQSKGASLPLATQCYTTHGENLARRILHAPGADLIRLLNVDQLPLIDFKDADFKDAA